MLVAQAEQAVAVAVAVVEHPQQVAQHLRLMTVAMVAMAPHLQFQALL